MTKQGSKKIDSVLEKINEHAVVDRIDDHFEEIFEQANQQEWSIEKLRENLQAAVQRFRMHESPDERVFAPVLKLIIRLDILAARKDADIAAIFSDYGADTYADLEERGFFHSY